MRMAIIIIDVWENMRVKGFVPSTLSLTVLFVFWSLLFEHGVITIVCVKYRRVYVLV